MAVMCLYLFSCLQLCYLALALLTVKGIAQMLEATPLPHKIKFTKYDQSSQCKTRRDSSVSYASAVVLSDSCEAS